MGGVALGIGIGEMNGIFHQLINAALRYRYFALMATSLEKIFRQIPGVIDVVSDGGPTKNFQVNVDPYRFVFEKSKARLILRRRLAALTIVSTARTSLSPGDAIVVKRARLLVLSRQGQRLRFGMRQTRHAYLIRKPDLCHFVIVTAARRYRILHLSSTDS